MSKRQPTEETSDSSTQVNDLAEGQLNTLMKTSDNLHRAVILQFTSFTRHDADLARAGDYHLIDLVKTLIYLDAGTDAVRDIFDINVKPARFMYFRPGSHENSLYGFVATRKKFGSQRWIISVSDIKPISNRLN